MDHDRGRQVVLVHVQNGQEQAVATVNRAADWQYVDAPIVAPDDSTAVLFIDIGAKPAGVVVPLGGTGPTFHPGHFAGFVDSAASTTFTAGPYEGPTETTPAFGQAYVVPPLDQLIAAELAMNPGRKVLGMASRDAVIGQTDTQTFEVDRDKPGSGEAYLDCFGPSSVTVTSGTNTTTSPCLRSGSYGVSIEARGPIVVTASGDTSWRVVIYSP